MPTRRAETWERFRVRRKQIYPGRAGLSCCEIPAYNALPEPVTDLCQEYFGRDELELSGTESVESQEGLVAQGFRDEPLEGHAAIENVAHASGVAVS